MKIYLLQLVILMSLSLNLQAQNLSGTIRGKVTCHGKGLQGVVVTDGIDCVLTNKSGEYVLAPQRDARFVYLSVPSGYQPKTEKTIPLFHQQIEMDKQDGYNFELMKNPQNDANHLFLVQADVQVTSEDDVKAYGRFLQDIKFSSIIGLVIQQIHRICQTVSEISHTCPFLLRVITEQYSI